MNSLRSLIFPAAVVILSALVFTASAHADDISWNAWSSGTPGDPGSATGAIPGGPTVTYSGQISSLVLDYPSWTPSSTYVGGAVGNAPLATDNIIQMTGGTGLAESITFSSPIVNPVIAIWSLGSGGNPASFDFTSTEPFSVAAGGPSAEYGGGSITQGTGANSENVYGEEGNGVIQFVGTYSEIDFTTPGFENWYGFTVGEDATLTNASPVPEPETFMLLGLGLAVLPFLRVSLASRRRS
jgi:hypothetical protein